MFSSETGNALANSLCGSPPVIPVTVLSPFSEFLIKHFYFSACLALVFLALLSLLVFAGHRNTSVISGALSLPCGLYAIFFVPEYWDPVRVFRWFIDVGPEDFLFSFANGCLVWLLCVMPLGKRRPRFEISAHPLLLRYGTCCGIFIPALFIGPVLGMGVMTSFLVASSAVVIVALCRNPKLWVFSLSGASLFPLFYFLVTAALFALKPSFLDEWNLVQLSGVRVLRVPLEEILWAFGYGCGWCTVMAFSFDAKFPKANVPPRPRDPAGAFSERQTRRRDSSQPARSHAMVDAIKIPAFDGQAPISPQKPEA
ncbi:MAG: hypothetical protein JXO72_14170 [Vicinamibacteria bacterium]|nr:hypothetical protein [Vicinamibacteria bacterium]